MGCLLSIAQAMQDSNPQTEASFTRLIQNREDDKIIAFSQKPNEENWYAKSNFLQTAIKLNQQEYMKTLIDKGFQITLFDRLHLIYMTYENREKGFFLHYYQKYPDRVNTTSPSALRIGTTFNMPELIDFALENGADVNEKEKKDDLQCLLANSPLTCAIAHKNRELFERLVAKGAVVEPPNNGPLNAAVINKDYDMINYLISKGYNVNQGACLTPLIIAIAMGNNSMVNFLIDNCGADVELRPTGNPVNKMENSVSPYQLAYTLKLRNIQQKLIDSGACETNQRLDEYNVNLVTVESIKVLPLKCLD